MKYRMLAFLVLVCLPTLDDPKQESSKKASQSLQGTWELVVVEQDDKVLHLKGKLTIEGDKWTTTYNETHASHALADLDTTKQPKWLDLKIESGPLKGKTALAIYKLDGDKLAICMSEADKPRPKEFFGKAKSNNTLFIYQRKTS